MENQEQYLLSVMLQGKDWFHSIGEDSYGRHIVYTKYMDLDVINEVPDIWGDKKVLLYFAPAESDYKDSYKNPLANNGLLNISSISDELAEDLELDKDLLIQELNKMKQECGSNIVQDLFYEVHDGKNAITNLSSKFPELRKSVEKLYEEYGFDVIYQEIEQK